MPLTKDLLHPSLEEEKRKHKKKRLVQSPNSHFTNVKCPGYYRITTVFSHAQTVVLCVGCSTVLCSLQEDKQGLQKDVPSDRSSTKNTQNEVEWKTIPINTFWILKKCQGAWVAQLVKHPTLDFSSRHNLGVLRSSPASSPPLDSILCMESACPSSLPYSQLSVFLLLSLYLPLSQINK
uniref:40S ribosomal protein S27-like n=1 Tax=Ursus americanus TaxID=9643 RepID=A0A452R6T8_URSAM